MARLGWSKDVLDTLYQKLERANCISVKNPAYGYSSTDDGYVIGFKHNEGATFSYVIYDPVFSRNVNSMEPYLTHYTENVFLMYDNGVIFY